MPSQSQGAQVIPLPQTEWAIHSSDTRTSRHPLYAKTLVSPCLQGRSIQTGRYRERDDFQADALCDNGYCYQVYTRNDPAPKKYLDMSLSCRHSRTMWLFDSLKYDHHHVCMDNLYSSVMFCKAAFTHSKGVMCHGELKNIRAQQAAQETLKAAAVLEGDPECAFLIASGVYDTQPVHYLSMVTSVIEWVEKEKIIYNVETDKKEKMKFLQLNQLDNYNNGMEDVGIADQLRGVYRLDRWVKKRTQRAIHKWLGLRKDGSLMNCATCNVHLCIDCYGTFHWSADLLSQKTKEEEVLAVDGIADVDVIVVIAVKDDIAAAVVVVAIVTDHNSIATLTSTAAGVDDKDGDCGRKSQFDCNLDLDDSKYCFKFTTPCCLCGTNMGFCCSLWCFLGGGDNKMTSKTKKIVKHDGPDV
eukprot:jgi/Psemu1/59592/gm1.59592_g